MSKTRTEVGESPLTLVFPGNKEEGDEDVGWWHPLPWVFGLGELLTQPALKS